MAESLDQAEDPKDPLVNRVLRMMATSAMSQAVYFATGTQGQDQYQSKSPSYHYGITEDHTVSVSVFITFVRVNKQNVTQIDKVFFPATFGTSPGGLFLSQSAGRC